MGRLDDDPDAVMSGRDRGPGEDEVKGAGSEVFSTPANRSLASSREIKEVAK